MKSPASRPRGFSLIELLVVVVIMAILATLVIPAFLPSRATNVTLAAHMIADTLDQAREAATSQNRFTEVRFYNINGSFRALKAYIYDDTFTTATPLTRLMYLPTGIVMSPTTAYSTLLSSATNPSAGTETLPLGPAAPYTSVQFHPGGATTLNPAGAGTGNTYDQWFVTVAAAVDLPTGGLPARDFATVQINPVSGRLMFYHP